MAFALIPKRSTASCPASPAMLKPFVKPPFANIGRSVAFALIPKRLTASCKYPILACRCAGSKLITASCPPLFARFKLFKNSLLLAILKPSINPPFARVLLLSKSAFNPSLAAASCKYPMLACRCAGSKLITASCPASPAILIPFVNPPFANVGILGILALNDCPPTPGTQSGIVTPIPFIALIALLIRDMAELIGPCNIAGIEENAAENAPVMLLHIAEHPYDMLFHTPLMYAPNCPAYAITVPQFWYKSTPIAIIAAIAAIAIPIGDVKKAIAAPSAVVSPVDIAHTAFHAVVAAICA